MHIYIYMRTEYGVQSTGSISISVDSNITRTAIWYVGFVFWISTVPPPYVKVISSGEARWRAS